MNEEWLEDILEPCHAAVVAVLVGYGVSPQEATELASDAVMFACEQALKRQEPFESIEHCRNWLLKVAVNHAIQILRTEKRHREILEKLPTEKNSRTAGDNPLGPFLKAMLAAIDRLPDEDRQLIERHYFERVTLKELADEFGLGSLTAAWRRLFKIRLRLQEIMIAQDAVPDGWETSQPSGEEEESPGRSEP